MDKNKLMEITPDKWGLLMYLSEASILDLNKLKTAMKEIAKSRLEFAEEMLKKAKKLQSENPIDRLIINRCYYCMYHSVRAAVYTQLQLDVEKHQALIEKFRKLLLREFSDDTLADRMDKMRISRNECDYNPFKATNAYLCNRAITYGELILNTCKELVEAF